MDKKNLRLIKNKGVKSMPTAMKIKPIKATPTVKDKYAQEVIREALRKPSENAIRRNKAASSLLAKLKG